MINTWKAVRVLSDSPARYIVSRVIGERELGK